MELQVATECCGGNQYECCGVGRCNVFCCNCDDGCKPMAVDANGDNALDKHEFKSYLTATNRTFITDGFDGLDVNRNGYVDPHEFDRELH
ncbi:hypothetical protein AAVH_11934 [Aphelenchoides avenae]|nr:hypothetical protein AAVH_11934 [Aphelenchus avenae]